MFDWLRAISRWLEHFVIGAPIYVAGPMMLLIGALDSSLLSLPEINDYLVVGRCYKHHSAVFYFPLFAAVGSVLGCLLLYSIMRRGGQALLRRRFKAEHILRAEQAYARFGVLALAVPAVLPPPLPFKIFVATAGTLEYPRWKFLVTVMIARSLRYYVEGTLAVFYGRRVLTFIEKNGIAIISFIFAAGLVALLIYLLSGRGRAATTAGKEAREQAKTEAPVSK
ncbi:MAG TPA: VTT domain-containing protein [Pyrinomonadaceae bacterium]|jgi:membrane protein YqaA with SNARE-associated domain|nr:VTT domain-containing protein [Pyrinomonadaceae bacterium]